MGPAAITRAGVAGGTAVAACAPMSRFTNEGGAAIVATPSSGAAPAAATGSGTECMRRTVPSRSALFNMF